MAVTWEAPERRSTNIVVGIDPPTGWCVFGAEGIVDAGQHATIDRARRAIDGVLRAVRPRRVHTAVVEEPYGIDTRRRNFQEVILNAIACGWWLREFHTSSFIHWVPTASQWRRVLGIPTRDREIGKRHAIQIAGVLCDVQGRPRLAGPRGGEMEHASEAVCMALSCWMRYGMVSRDDAAHRLIQRLGIPYQGGKPSTESNIRPAFAIDGKDRKPKKRRSPEDWRNMAGVHDADDGDGAEDREGP